MMSLTQAPLPCTSRYRQVLETLACPACGETLVEAGEPVRRSMWGISGGPSAALAWILQEYLALPFAWSRLAYAIAYRTAGLLTSWLRWLDVLLDRFPQARRIACGFYAIGERPHAEASGRERT